MRKGRAIVFLREVADTHDVTPDASRVLLCMRVTCKVVSDCESGGDWQYCVHVHGGGGLHPTD